MEEAKGSVIVKGVVLSILYCIAYLILRYLSFDQWFLPAGLRAACLLFIPYRYWLFVFIGDVLALLYIRIPKAHTYSAIWVYIGPLLLIISSSIAPYASRKILKKNDAIARWLPFVGLSIAFWSLICTMAFNYWLGGPEQPANSREFLSFFIGNYLTILIGALAFLMWDRRALTISTPAKIVRDTAIVSLAISILYFIATHFLQEDHFFLQSIMMLMIVPAAYLIFSHGWHGAGISVIAINLGIALALKATGIPGTFDTSVFYAQEGIAIAATILLLLGNVINSYYIMAIKFGAEKQEARQFARTSVGLSEPASRDQLLYMAQMRILLDEAWETVTQTLKANGKQQEAMRLNGEIADVRRQFDQLAIGVYPIGIERNGLFAVVQSQAFIDRWARGVDIAMRFDDGDPKLLSLNLQLLAYRCVSDAIVLLGDWQADQHRLRMRTWRGKHGRGIYFSVVTAPAETLQLSKSGAVAALMLDTRVNAHGGIVHRHAHRVSVLLSEPNE